MVRFVLPMTLLGILCLAGVVSGQEEATYTPPQPPEAGNAKHDMTVTNIGTVPDANPIGVTVDGQPLVESANPLPGPGEWKKTAHPEEKGRWLIEFGDAMQGGEEVEITISFTGGTSPVAVPADGVCGWS